LFEVRALGCKYLRLLEEEKGRRKHLLNGVSVMDGMKERETKREERGAGAE